MLLEITKKEMREVVLNETRYVCHADRSYFRFTPKDGDVEVLNFIEWAETKEFKVDSRIGLYEHQIDIIEVTGKYMKEITEDEFNTKLQELLLKYI